MSRKPNDPVKLNLRFTEALRLRMEKAAERNNRSMNEEIIRRLEESFAKEDRRQEFEALAESLAEKVGKVIIREGNRERVITRRGDDQ